MPAVINVTLGQTFTCSIQYLDQHGNVMNPPVPDSPPAWANTNPEVETLTPSADGSLCGVKTLAGGQDNVSLSVTVGGTIFTDQLSVQVATEAQKLSAIRILATIDTPPPA